MASPAGSVNELGLQRAGPTAEVKPYHNTAESVAETARKARVARLDPDLRRWAADALMAVGIDGRGNPGTVQSKCQAILDAYRRSVIYSADPAKSEWIQAPHVTLCLRDLCIPIGDCDDGVAAVAGALLTLGMFPFIVHQKFQNAQEHVLVGIYDESGRKLYVDTANTTSPVYSGSRAKWEAWVDPLEQMDPHTGSAGPDFVTLGAVGAEGSRMAIMPASQLNPQLTPQPAIGLGLVSTSDMDQLDAQTQAEVTGLQDAVKACPNLPQTLQDSITGFAAAWAVLHQQWQSLRSYVLTSWNPGTVIVGAIELQFLSISTDMRGYLARAQDYKTQIHAACPTYTPTPGPVVPVPAPQTPSPASQLAEDITVAAKAVGGLLVIAGIVYGGFKVAELVGNLKK